MGRWFILCTGVIATLFVIFHLTIGFNFEFLESHLPAVLSGKVTNGHPLNMMYFSAHYPLADWVYVPLYSRFEHYFPFYEAFMYTFMVCSGSIIAYVTHEKIKRLPGALYALTAVTLVFVYFALTLNLQHTIVGFLLCTAATSLLYLDPKGKTNRSKITIYILPIILFTLGLFVRVQVGVFFAIINFVAFILLRSTSREGKYVVFIFLLITLTHYGLILKNRELSNDYCQKMDVVTGYQLMDRGNIVPLGEMHTYTDSVKYLSAINSISDPKYLTIKDIEALIAHHPIFGVEKQYFVRAYNILYNYFVDNKGLILLYLTIATITLLSCKDDRKQLVRWILFNLFFWGLIALVTYNIKMEFWLFRSAIFAMIVIHTINVKRTSAHNRLVSYILLPVGVIALGMFCRQELKHFTTVKQRTYNNQAASALIASKCRDKIIVPGLSQSPIYMANFFPFEKPDFSVYRSIYYFDTDVLFWQLTYNEWVTRDCKCETGDVVSFMDYLSDNKAAYITTKDRIEKLQTYCSAIRKVDYTFTITDSLEYNNKLLYVFEIESVQ